jgi:hypothetical protein
VRDANYILSKTVRQPDPELPETQRIQQKYLSTVNNSKTLFQPDNFKHLNSSCLAFYSRLGHFFRNDMIPDQIIGSSADDYAGMTPKLAHSLESRSNINRITDYRPVHAAGRADITGNQLS